MRYGSRIPNAVWLRVNESRLWLQDIRLHENCTKYRR
jgi:hypothetical protein